MKLKYSVVIPLKDEEDNVEILISEIEPVMESIGEDWEMICIDDGSTDRTRSILEELAETKSFLKPLFFDKNYGQSSAFDAGFKKAVGEYIITLDGDLQNDPKDIPKLIAKADNADMVCGCRLNRKDTFTKKITSKLANKVRGKICRDNMKDTGCSLKLYRKSCLEKIKLFDGMHRFLPALFKNEGFLVIEVPVNHRHRQHGNSKYNFLNRSFNTIADMLAVRWMRKRRLKYKIKQETL
ncbi:MAG: glycosyltransferase family 2 protein [Chlamydiota bacterium]|nr:glycosyltransferase family 2 protein [Chlamydiota bacterium]